MARKLQIEWQDDAESLGTSISSGEGLAKIDSVCKRYG